MTGKGLVVSRYALEDNSDKGYHSIDQRKMFNTLRKIRNVYQEMNEYVSQGERVGYYVDDKGNVMCTHDSHHFELGDKPRIIISSRDEESNTRITKELGLPKFTPPIDGDWPVGNEHGNCWKTGFCD